MSSSVQVPMEQPIFVRRDDGPLHWHEAVALIRSVTDALEAGQLRSVPAPGELALKADGSLYLTPGAVATKTDSARQAATLRELLGGLLPADAPAELRALAEGQASTLLSLPEFRDALAFFERPSSNGDRQALAARLAKVQEERQLETEIERLRRKARAEAERLPDEGRAAAQPAPARKRSKTVLLAIAGLGLAGAVVTALVFAPVSVGGVLTAGSTGESGAAEKGIIGKLKDAAQSAFGTTSREPAAATSTDTPAPAVTARKTARRPARGNRPSSGPRDASFEVPHAPLANVRLLPAHVAAWSVPELKLPDDVASIFSRGDLDVVPPTLVRPHLPTVGSVGVPSEQLGTVDVIVAEDGRVEQVRLVRTSAERSFYDAMILAAVKAWVFRPASRSGQPVRYRLQIRLT